MKNIILWYRSVVLDGDVDIKDNDYIINGKIMTRNYYITFEHIDRNDYNKLRRRRVIGLFIMLARCQFPYNGRRLRWGGWRHSRLALVLRSVLEMAAVEMLSQPLLNWSRKSLLRLKDIKYLVPTNNVLCNSITQWRSINLLV